MLTPISLKYKKYHKIYIPKYSEKKVLRPYQGGYGIKVLESGKLTNKQLDAIFKFIKKKIKKTDKFWFNCFTDKVVTKKGLGSRMGKGKGMPDHWVCTVRKGAIIFEFGGLYLSYPKIKSLFIECKHKLPLKVSLVKRLI